MRRRSRGPALSSVRRARRRAGAPAIEGVATVARHLAVLLEAGVPLASACEHAARSGAPPATRRTLRAAADAARGGDAVAHAVIASTRDLDVSGAWTALAAVLEVATGAGAPLGPSLRAAAAAFRDAAETQRDLGVALAGPRATSRLIAWLPLVTVLFGLMLGFDSLRVLATTAPGWCCAVAGIGLLCAGRAWSARLVRRAQPAAGMPGLLPELVAIGLSGGGSPAHARVLAVEAARGVPAAAERTVDDVLALAQAAGAPAVELLRAAAEQERLDARTAGRERATRLGVTLMVPMGVCVLPAFLLLGVAPLLISVVSSTDLRLA